MPDVRLWAVDAARLEAEAETLGPCFEAAAGASYGRVRAEDIAASAQSGALLVFLVIDFGAKVLQGALCVAKSATPGAVVAQIAHVGLHPAALPPGDGAWSVAMHQLAQHMGKLGCEQIEFVGAPVFGRALGLEPTGAQFVVSLTRGARQ